MAQGRRTWWLALGLIAAVAFALRFLYLGQFAALPIFADPVGDSAAHLHRAAEIAQGKWLPARPFYYCSIFYPYFLALVLAGMHGSLATVAAIQLAAGTGVVVLVALLGRRAFGDVAGLISGALATLYGPSAFFEADVLGVVWGQLALCAGMLLVLLWSTSRRRSTAAWAGVAFGLAAVERPNLLLVALVTIGWIAWSRRSAVIPFLAGLAGPLLVVLALNVAGTGQWVPLTTSGGINLALGYHDGANGTYDEPWEHEAPEFSAQHVEPEEAMIAWASLETGRTLSPQEASRYWLDRTLSWIARHPRESLALTFRKTLLMLNAVEVPNHLDFAFIRARASALKLLFVGFAPVLALAGVGFAARRRDPVAIYFALVALAAMLSVVPFTVADRYRAPMLPGLFLLAGAGVLSLRHPRVLPLACGAALLAISAIPLIRPLEGRNHWMFAQAYERRGDLPRAITSYEAAVKAEPGDAQLLNNLGNAYRRAGRLNAAQATLERAVRVEPRLAYPHKSLGVVLIGEGRLPEALAELQAAHEILPTDAEVLGMIGAVHAERGEWPAADSAFAQARVLAPNDRRLDALIAQYAARRASPPSGR